MPKRVFKAFVTGYLWPILKNTELSAVSAVLDKAAEAKQAPAARPAATKKEEAAPAKPNEFATMAAVCIPPASVLMLAVSRVAIFRR